MPWISRLFALVASLAAAWLAVIALVQHPILAEARDDERPALALKATPQVGFAPAEIRLSVEVKGGPDDYERFYCPAIEWDWGDETSSELRSDCDPYEQRKSEITRRYRTTHIYQTAGNYRIVFRLKRGSRVVGSASTAVQVRSGLRDPGNPW
ncbi:MAG: hypothetical protein GEV06_11865 [Luteitalea sp.]|nr:hypothetical protein [Luteitalea sp.]